MMLGSTTVTTTPAAAAAAAGIAVVLVVLGAATAPISAAAQPQVVAGSDSGSRSDVTDVVVTLMNALETNGAPAGREARPSLVRAPRQTGESTPQPFYLRHV